MNSLFKSEQGKKQILSLYNEKLKELPIEFECKTVHTNYGDTNIIVVGDATKPPILLVYGSNGCAPIALETYPNLYKKFEVFIIDVLAQPNKSSETRLSMKDNRYGLWIIELLHQLELKNVTLAGFSFGGLLILKT
jgi:pimeloyl-ACP methyl ester carboxylesterase